MSNISTTTTLVSRKKKGSGADSTVQQIQNVIKTEQGAGFQAGGTVTPNTPNTPGVSNKLAGDLLPFAAPHQLPWFNPPSGVLSTDSSGASTITYANWVALIHEAKDNPTLLDRIQRSLKQAQLLPKSWANYGTLDKATTTAWQNLGQSAIGGNESAMSLLNDGMTEGNLGALMSAVQTKASSALSAAASVQAPMLTLTDPNHVAQAYATAMESMGMGAPSKAQTAKFVGAFHDAEVKAVQDATEAQKSADNAGYNAEENRLHTLANGLPVPPTPTMPQPGQSGYGVVAEPGTIQPGAQDLYNRQVSQFDATMNQNGPVTVAQKALPNLDSEAIASAQNTNPAQYYATGSTYLYGLLQRMLNGDMSLPTAPQSPTSQTPAGGIVTAPLTGAP